MTSANPDRGTGSFSMKESMRAAPWRKQFPFFITGNKIICVATNVRLEI
jgi:hypothetical protein